MMKHSLFMTKVHDSGVKKLKRRRPGNKLVANLESLGDALQEVVEDEGVDGAAAPRMKNVREGRGQAKRKEKVVREETQRFGQNMAALATASTAQVQKDETAAGGGRWSALRAHINGSTPDASSGAG